MEQDLNLSMILATLLPPAPMHLNFRVELDAWPQGLPIPAHNAFGQPGEDAPFAPAGNVSPAIRWSSPPEGTRSFALICHDPDVPSSGEDVNQPGRTVPADLARVDFFHWVLVDLPGDCTGLEEGAGGRGITPRGKPTGPVAQGVTGANDYTSWFAGDADMEGTYGGYDGPCPPWNDSIVHHYHFTVYALDVDSLGLEAGFDGRAARAALEGHVLAQATYVGTYSMNPSVPGLGACAIDDGAVGDSRGRASKARRVPRSRCATGYLSQRRWRARGDCPRLRHLWRTLLAALRYRRRQVSCTCWGRGTSETGHQESAPQRTGSWAVLARAPAAFPQVPSSTACPGGAVSFPFPAILRIRFDPADRTTDGAPIRERAASACPPSHHGFTTTRVHPRSAGLPRGARGR